MLGLLSAQPFVFHGLPFLLTVRPVHKCIAWRSDDETDGTQTHHEHSKDVWDNICEHAQNEKGRVFPGEIRRNLGEEEKV